MIQISAVVLSLSLVVSVFAQEPDQKMTLFSAAAPTSDRFTVPADRVWPADHGQADVCLWADDKLAAISLTVDDNYESDIPTWTNLCDRYGGIKMSWMIMWEQNFSGWENFIDLFNAGHGVQGHDVTSINSLLDNAYEAKLRGTQRLLERNIPGNKGLVFAYPGGNANAVQMEIAAKYYVACRGVVGHPNRANRIWYTKTNSTTPNQTNFAKVLTSGNYYRGWLSTHIHGYNAGNTAQYNQAYQYLQDNEDDLWVGLWADVARYSQSYVTHTLAVTSVADETVTFTVSDSMLDAKFDYPLTVKVRVNNNWPYAAATQGGSGISAVITEHGGNKYALVQAVPDAGEVILTRSTVGITRQKFRAVAGDGFINGALYNMAGQPVRVPQQNGMYLLLDSNGNTVSKIMYTR